MSITPVSGSPVFSSVSLENKEKYSPVLSSSNRPAANSAARAYHRAPRIQPQSASVLLCSELPLLDLRVLEKSVPMPLPSSQPARRLSVLQVLNPTTVEKSV